MGYGQQAGGTHPTGMHTCFVVAINRYVLLLFVESIGTVCYLVIAIGTILSCSVLKAF